MWRWRSCMTGRPSTAGRRARLEIEKAFGQPVEELFDSIDHKALASGSIAQVWPRASLCRNVGLEAVAVRWPEISMYARRGDRVFHMRTIRASLSVSHEDI